MNILSVLFGSVNIFYKNFAQMAHNVPAVYDVFAVAIKEREAFQQPQKCGSEKPQSAYGLCAVFRSPSRRKAAKRKQTCYVPLCRTPLSFILFFD
jgi:hypothetical protein